MSRFATPSACLQRPETSKFPKVARRGCKRCFEPREQRSPKSLLRHLKPVLHQCKLSFAPVQEAFGTLGPKDLLRPLPTTFGNSHFRAAVRERKISPKFFRPKFFHGRPRRMSVPKCLFFQDFEGLTEVLAGCPQGYPANNFLFGPNFRS